jgi:hypothetical protein
MRKNEKGEIVEQWFSEDLNWKAKVVCKPCNEGWMSNIEAQHAKPAMTDLITGGLDVPISESRARSVSLFAFKSAVVFDHVARTREPFFLRSIRHRFREALAVPHTTVQMWMAGFLLTGKGEVFTSYHEGNLSPSNHVRLYVCTYAIGHFVFQVVGQRQQGFTPFGPLDRRFDGSALPFFPTRMLPRGLTWPVADVLRTAQDLEDFALRWKDIRVVR